MKQLEHQIRARHAVLVRMFGKKHDMRYDIPIISNQACDCIQTIMSLNGYKLIGCDRSALLKTGWSHEKGMGRWEKVAG